MSLRVLHVIKSLGLGGAESLLVDGARAAAALDMHHDVVSFLPWKDALIPALRAAGADVTVIEARSSAMILASADKLAKHLRKRRPDVVHAHLPISGVVARIACALTRTPCVYTEHNVLERYHPLTLALALSTWPLQRAVVACSGEVALSIERRARGGPRPVIVQNGISGERFAFDDVAAGLCRQQLGFDDDAFVIGTVAVQRTQKALDRWLNVAAAVHRRCARARFVLVGDGPLRASLEAKARDLGINDVVVFAGLQKDPRPFLWAMDVFLSTSIFEGLPLALLEAMAASRAVVVTAVGGVPEVVVDGDNGFLLRAGDDDGAVSAVLALLDADRRAVIGERARETVIERFGTARMQAQLLSIYRSIA
ncbi:MAG: glycosyltransferase [Deltaproteobacteria bacterium]|nr:glycosyltransferase [Deltaproteobacteria bacterium]